MFKECGRRRPTYTISSIVSLRLRWAKKERITPDKPKTGNGLIQWIRMEESTRHIWVNVTCNMSRLMTKTNKMTCAQRRLRSAWASAQSDQSLRWATKALFMRTAKTLIRLGGCPGWSESSLGAQSFCWFCHEAAHIYFNILLSLAINLTNHHELIKQKHFSTNKQGHKI